MNSTVVTLNDWAGNGLAFAWPVLWQSSVLIALMFGLELALRRKLRAAVRYALWLVILVKLLLPPSLALPSGVGWWVRPSLRKPTIHRESAVMVSYPSDRSEAVGPPRITILPEIRPALSLAAWGLLAWTGVGLGLLIWMLIRWRQVTQEMRKASAAPDWLEAELRATCAGFGCRRHVQVKVLEPPESPALSGLFRPTLLVPRRLVEQLAPGEMRGVLLHELMHLRRGDIWINCAQAVLQIIYWWHPLLWLANARIRHVREEAVDDAVMLALRNDSGTYAPTLVAVARLAMRRPVISLGLVGILESHTSLRRRIERLLDFRPPARAGLTLASCVSVLAFAAVALPMGQAPASPERDLPAARSNNNPWPDPRFAGYAEIKLEPQFLIADEAGLRVSLPSLVDAHTPLLFTSNQVAELESKLQQANAQLYTSAEPLTFAKFSGGTFSWRIGGVTNNAVNYLTKVAKDQRNVVIGAEARFVATQPEWVPLELTVVPWSEDSSVRCQIQLGLAGNPNAPQQGEATVPPGGAVLLVTVADPNAGKYEIVLLEEKSSGANVEKTGSESRSGTETPSIDKAAAAANSKSALATTASGNNKAIDPGSPVARWKLKGILSQNDSERVAIINQGNYHLGDEIQGYKIIRITGDEVWFQGPREKERLGLDYVQGGKQLLESGQLSQAGAQFEKALEKDPANQAAQYYRDRVRRAIYAKLRDTRLQTVSFDHLPLREVLVTLSSYTQDPKSGNKTVDFGYNDDIGDVRITIQPHIIDISLLDVIDAVAKVASTPLKYSFTSSGVIFARKSTEPVMLYTRIIKVDPATFVRNLHSANASYKSGAPAQAEVREFFAASGVDLNPPKSIFFNDREGTLLVRTTLPDLDKVERLVAELSPKEQINIKTKFVVAPEEVTAQLWRTLGRADALDVSASGLSAILTPAQAAVLVKAFASSPGGILSEASVTTLTGRETQVQTIDLKTIVTNINPRALASPGISSKELKSDLYQTATVPFGPTMDIVPLMQADGLHIQLVTDLELTSYSEVTNEVSIFVDGQPYSVAVPAPRLQVGKATANVVVSDGQSLLLEAEMVDETSPSSSPSKANRTSLLALVTPVIIDPAGNALHPEQVSRQSGSQK